MKKCKFIYLAMLGVFAVSTAQALPYDQKYWNQKLQIEPFRLPLPPVGYQVEYIDLNGDGKPDAIKSVTVNDTPILWLDDDANMKEGDIEGDMINESVFFCDNFYNITCVSMGNPNCVVMMEEISRNKALHLGPYVENSKYFPNRINMQLCHVVDRENIQIEIYERGAGYTYASGTGACAAASAAHKLGLVGNRVQVHMQGGDLLVEFAEDDRVFMTGPVVYIGSITLAENFFA